MVSLFSLAIITITEPSNLYYVYDRSKKVKIGNSKSVNETITMEQRMHLKASQNVFEVTVVALQKLSTLQGWKYWI